jgi:RNA polymerase sigma-70 factor (ECF subfamily)
VPVTDLSATAYADLAPDRLDLLAALRQLPAAQREVIGLHHLADLPVAEVAETLGIPVGTVKARLSRGRAALAHLLEDQPERSER